MRSLVFFLLLAPLLLCGCAVAGSPSNSAPPASAQDDPSTLEVRGKVVFITLEGGFFGIVGDDGRRFDPLELPEEFRRDGLPVRARVRPIEGTVSFRMWGTTVEILQIEKCPQPLR